MTKVATCSSEETGIILKHDVQYCITNHFLELEIYQLPSVNTQTDNLCLVVTSPNTTDHFLDLEIYQLLLVNFNK